MNLVYLVGWLFLVLSWILPGLFKDREKKLIVGIALSSMATGIFMGHLLESIAP
jgi:hypothetical protein